MKPLNLPVEEFTTPNPITATEDAAVGDMLATMRQYDIRHLPIIRGDKVVGVVSDRDCRVAYGLNQAERRLVCASDIMVLDPVTVSAADSLDEVALQMSEKKIGSVIVNDENDNMLGIFTATDALNALIEISRERGAN